MLRYCLSLVLFVFVLALAGGCSNAPEKPEEFKPKPGRIPVKPK